MLRPILSFPEGKKETGAAAAADVGFFFILSDLLATVTYLFCINEIRVKICSCFFLCRILTLLFLVSIDVIVEPRSLFHDYCTVYTIEVLNNIIIFYFDGVHP